MSGCLDGHQPSVSWPILTPVFDRRGPALQSARDVPMWERRAVWGLMLVLFGGHLWATFAGARPDPADYASAGFFALGFATSAPLTWRQTQPRESIWISLTTVFAALGQVLMFVA